MSIDWRAPAARMRRTLTFAAASIGAGMFSCLPVLADDAAAGPCGAANAAALADRPGTGRTTSTGGSPCVVVLGGVIVESGFRRQITDESAGGNTLASSWLTLVRVGIARRLEFAVAPPSNESRSIFGTSTFDAARGATDVVTAVKYLVIDTSRWQASVGAAYSAPTGTGEFTAGSPTFGVSANVGFALTPRLSVSTSQVVGTSIGNDAQGQSRSYFIAAPSFTVSYALDGSDALLVQDAFVSRQSPVLPAGNRGFVALQRTVGSRLAIDVEWERNLAPTVQRYAQAVGFGFVWSVLPGPQH